VYLLNVDRSDMSASAVTDRTRAQAPAQFGGASSMPSFASEAGSPPTVPLCCKAVRTPMILRSTFNGTLISGRKIRGKLTIETVFQLV
jgi:hypothetical protein